MSKKFLFTDANGDYEETPGAYEISDHINVSTGVSDAGKPIVLDATGKIDPSMLDFGDIDHGSLAGLGDDDHTQYILVDGTRAFTGDQSMGTNQLTNVGDPVTTTIDGASDDAVPMSFLASTANGEGASVIGIEDVAGNYVSTDVEGALAEVYTLAAREWDRETGTAGGTIAKGDLLYFSANDTVSTMAITSANNCVGVALNAATIGQTVEYSRWDEICTGVLTAATAGDMYFWDGTNLTTTIPAGAGQYVWRGGIAKNATDLLTTVEFVKKNA
jgi:hypothetical protein